MPAKAGVPFRLKPALPYCAILSIMIGFDSQPTTRVIFGENCLNQVGELVRELGAVRVLIVTDRGIRQVGYADRVKKSLQQQGIDAFEYGDVEENPTDLNVQIGADFARENSPIDLIIGLGGGSSMDVAKGINFLFTNGGKMQDYWGFNRATKPMLPAVGIPTTAGTGSEAQSYALISQDDTHIKMACGDIKARFRTVILDPVLTLTAPKNITAISGIDAITHSVETFVTKNRNPFSQMHSREAWRLLNRSFEKVLSDPSNLEARADMLLGSYFAGVAIEHSMLGAAHACANPLTARYGIAHGVAVGMMLPSVIRFNSVEVSQLYFQLSDPLLERIQEFQVAASLPQRLRDCGVDQKTLQNLAEDAATQWTGKHNPRPLKEADFLDLYEETF
jgi:alcohol dehydrogenase